MKRSRAQGIVNRDKKVISPSYTREFPLVIDRGKGPYIWDIDNKKYLDFTSGIAVANVGHANPDVVKAIRAQADRITHNAGTDFYNQPVVEVAERLCKITPGSFSKRVFFTNSGTESVECAFKVARWYKDGFRIISFLGGFHGRTYGSMSLSGSKAVHRDHFGPLVPGVTHTPYPYCYRCPLDHEHPECGLACLKYLEDTILKKVVPKDEVAAVISEPILGEEGYVVPPKNFHKQLQKLCKKNGFLYISDEVQTGFARSGKWFASDIFGVKPDIMCLAKGIAAGMPMGACVARKEIMAWPKGAHASTFSGNPISCAAALASMEYIKKNRLAKNAERLGRLGLKRLNEMKESHSVIGDVRGLGLMLGLELVKNRRTKKPAPGKRLSLLNHAFKSGLLLLAGGQSSARIAPPLVITKEEFEKGLDTLENCFKKL
jgi:4-aminobutyrate aminotransferase